MLPQMPMMPTQMPATAAHSQDYSMFNIRFHPLVLSTDSESNLFLVDARLYTVGHPKSTNTTKGIDAESHIVQIIASNWSIVNSIEQNEQSYQSRNAWFFDNNEISGKKYCPDDGTSHISIHIIIHSITTVRRFWNRNKWSCLNRINQKNDCYWLLIVMIEMNYFVEVWLD